MPVWSGLASDQVGSGARCPKLGNGLPSHSDIEYLEWISRLAGHSMLDTR